MTTQQQASTTPEPHEDEPEVTYSEDELNAWVWWSTEPDIALCGSVFDASYAHLDLLEQMPVREALLHKWSLVERRDCYTAFSWEEEQQIDKLKSQAALKLPVVQEV